MYNICMLNKFEFERENKRKRKTDRQTIDSHKEINDKYIIDFYIRKHKNFFIIIIRVLNC